MESPDSGVTQVCTQCSENCIDCTSITSCDECESGLVWFNSLERCVECLLGCSFCDSDNITICYNCSTGYYMNSDDKCVGCPTGCKDCESDTVCKQCDSGYRLVNDVCSVACNHPCSNCEVDKPNACLECFGGYTYHPNNNTCESDLSCNDNSTC